MQGLILKQYRQPILNDIILITSKIIIGLTVETSSYHYELRVANHALIITYKSYTCVH